MTSIAPHAHTGTWLCPLCHEAIPFTLYGRKVADGFDYSDSPNPWVDVYWHIEDRHPEGMD